MDLIGILFLVFIVLLSGGIVSLLLSMMFMMFSEIFENFPCLKLLRPRRSNNLFIAQQATLLRLVNEIWENDKSPYSSDLEMPNGAVVIGKLLDYEVAMTRAIDQLNYQIKENKEKARRIEGPADKEFAMMCRMEQQRDALQALFEASLSMRMSDKKSGYGEIRIINGGMIVFVYEYFAEIILE